MSDPGAIKKSACILCFINCGLDVQTGGKDGRELVRMTGDRAHVSSRGYLCDKAARLNHYQSAADRLDTPMRRNARGTYDPVDWETAIREVAAGLNAVKQAHGGDKIYYVGQGGQGNHLCAVYSRALANWLGVRYKTNALAQEKTGEIWVTSQMFGAAKPHGDFHHAEVAVFLGKNPWQTHGFPQARKVLLEIAKDPDRATIVIDPALTESARMADYHIRLRPGTDAWCLSALIAVLVQEGLYDADFVDRHTVGFDAIRDHFQTLDIAQHCRICNVGEDLVRRVARRIARAGSVSVLEELGTQQNVHSTAVSYLQRILWVICGHFARKGGHNIPLFLMNVLPAGEAGAHAGGAEFEKSPVLGRRVIAGLLPCSEFADEILADHPRRFRGAIFQACNPVHSFAQTSKIRAAMARLEFSVVIDIAMTETALMADYVLPASSQFEKHECTFFASEFPGNYFHLRHPVVAPLPGTLPEAEIHTRLLEALGAYSDDDVRPLRTAAQAGRAAFFKAFSGMAATRPQMMDVASALIYRSLGAHIDCPAAAPLWALCHQFARKNPEDAANAGFTGDPVAAGEAMFEAVLGSPSGFEYARASSYEVSWERIGFEDRKIRLHLAELFAEIQDLSQAAIATDPEFPFILAAGNRRSSTANTIVRDHTWYRKDGLAALWISPGDAARLDLEQGDVVRITTRGGTGEINVEITDVQQDGTVALPNGAGLVYKGHDGREVCLGIPPNTLTRTQDCDSFAATPWHKYIPARLEKAHPRTPEG